MSCKRLAAVIAVAALAALAFAVLNLLGLIVHLDTVHLVITADSEGGILGQLLCGLAGGG